MELAYINIGLLTIATTFGLSRFWDISDAAKLFVLLVALALVENGLSLYSQLTNIDGIIITHLFLLIEGVLMITVFLYILGIKPNRKLIIFSLLSWAILCACCAFQDKNTDMSGVASLFYTIIFSALSIHVGIEYLKNRIQRNIMMQIVFILIIAIICTLIFLQDLNSQIKWVQIICYGIVGSVLYITRKNKNILAA
ncbi:MAG: hypothetical protein JSS64_12510 [Bacteroidetes bacterium]|nr:hypothetical protein [Bacteroidota bacterium]